MYTRLPTMHLEDCGGDFDTCIDIQGSCMRMQAWGMAAKMLSAASNHILSQTIQGECNIPRAITCTVCTAATCLEDQPDQLLDTTG